MRKYPPFGADPTLRDEGADQIILGQSLAATTLARDGRLTIDRR